MKKDSKFLRVYLKQKTVWAKLSIWDLKLNSLLHSTKKSFIDLFFCYFKDSHSDRIQPVTKSFSLIQAVIRGGCSHL